MNISKLAFVFYWGLLIVKQLNHNMWRLAINVQKEAIWVRKKDEKIIINFIIGYSRYSL